MPLDIFSIQPKQDFSDLKDTNIRKNKDVSNLDFSKTEDSQFDKELNRAEERTDKRVKQHKKPEHKSDKVTHKQVEQKVDEIEKKIENLKNSDKPIDKENLEKVEILLKKIKSILAKIRNNQGEGSKKVLLQLNDNKINLLAMMGMMLDEIDNLLAMPNKFEQLAKLTKKLDGKMAEVESLLDGDTAKINPEETNLNKPLNGELKREDITTKSQKPKVKVIDKRKNQFTVKGTKNNSVQENQKPAVLENGKNDLAVNMAKIKTQHSVKVASVKYTSFSNAVSRANIEALLQNVTGRAVIILKNGKSEFKMKLTPPELGKLDMRFTLEDGMLTGKIVVSSPEAKALFDEHLGELQRQMQAAGINLGSLDVSLGDENAQEQSEQAHTGLSGFIGDGSMDIFDDVSGVNYLFDSSVNYIA